MDGRADGWHQPIMPVSAASSTSPAPRSAKWLRWLLVLAALLGGLYWAFISDKPATPRHSSPTAAQATIGRDVAKRLRNSLGRNAKDSSLRFSGQELESISALIGNVSAYKNLHMGLADGRATGAISLPLPYGRWINATADIPSSSKGFPDVVLTIGRVTLPQFVTRGLIAAARRELNRRGFAVPVLDTLIHTVNVSNDALTVSIGAGVGGLRNAEVDPEQVLAIYCHLAELQRHEPTPHLSLQVQRAFSMPVAGGGAIESNRAAFVAMAMFAVDTRSADLAGIKTASIGKCNLPPQLLTLGGRDDLPKHWAMSAALSAALGNDLSKSMGEWKELADSLPNGSGFSFIDLTADRSGLHIAEAALNPETAAQMRAKLATASEQQLIPVAALGLQEGMTEAQFKARFTNIDSKDYAAAVAEIDRLLSRQ